MWWAFFATLRARLVYVFKNWKLLFENFCGNTCGWKNVWKCVKYCLKTENSCLKTQTKHPLRYYKSTMIGFYCFTLNYFCLGMGVLSRPPIGMSAVQPLPLTCAGRATFHSQTKEFCFVLFSYSSWHSHPDKGGYSFLLIPMACT